MAFSSLSCKLPVLRRLHAFVVAFRALKSAPAAGPRRRRR